MFRFDFIEERIFFAHFGRVLAICYPMKFQITKKRARAILLVIWIVALTTALPWPMYFRLSEALPSNPEMLFCMEHWPSPYEERVYFFVANILFCYLLPLHIILACYVMIWLQVWRRNIPTECKDAHTEQLHRRSKVGSFFDPLTILYTKETPHPRLFIDPYSYVPCPGWPKHCFSTDPSKEANFHPYGYLKSNSALYYPT